MFTESEKQNNIRKSNKGCYRIFLFHIITEQINERKNSTHMKTGGLQLKQT